MEPIAEHGRRDAVLETVTFAAERLLAAPTWRECIEDVLERLGRASAASRVHLFENHPASDGTMLMSLRHEWVAPEMLAGASGLAVHDFPYHAGFDRWATVLSAGGAIQGRLRDFPEGERRVMGSPDVMSMVLLPIFSGRDWWGFIGFEDCARERSRSPAEVDALRAAAATLGAAISRERTDERLREAEARYRTLVEHVPAVIYLTDTNRSQPALYISPQFEGLLGFTSEEHEADPDLWLRQIHRDDLARVLAEADRTDATGEPFVAEYRMHTRDGRIVWVADEARLQTDESGRRLFWRGVLVDVTERKRVEQALADSEELHRGLVEVSPDAVFVGCGGRFEFVNAAAVTLLGASDPSELLGRSVLDFIHPDYHDAVREKMRTVKQGGATPLMREKYVRLDGTEIDVEVAALALTYMGKPAGLVVARDITERRHTEEQLRQAEAKYRALVEQLPAIVYMAEFEAAGDWLYVSPQIETLLGYSPQEWKEDPTLFDQRIHPDDEAAYRVEEARSRATGIPLSAEYRMLARDGREVWFRDEAVVVRDDSRRPLFHQGIMFNVTESKRAEEALRDALEREQEASERLRALDEMRNAFLHAVSHELRTPLTSVMGFALTLSRKELNLSEPDQDDMLGRIVSNARKLERLLTDLLDVDRLARGILEPKLYPTNLGDLARRVVEDTDVGDRAVHVDAGAVIATVDGPKVERIVENLLSNAARHTPIGTSVWVRVQERADGVLLLVEDDGPGVPGQLKEEIFEPFRQGGGAKTHSPGTGIGLSLVARFAELHEGNAWVEDREGGGASFRVFLPAPAQARAS